MVTVYKQLGEEKIEELVDRFYDYVDKDSRMRFLFPEDLTETRHKQKLFQIQFLGGPNLYNERFGHPMLKMRHMPFKVTEEARDAWLDNMSKAMDDVKLPNDIKEHIYKRYEITANAMVNSR
ncbi:MAG TPA: globin [Candidatus Nosocomiicoccus stercorigallinarum]|nr:globin [Candidatus Nosocomiicoccus stercorigallinarum]